MKQFTLSLRENVQRPVANLHNWHHLDVMIDTGSLFPVWVRDESILESLDARRVKENVEFSGFGGKAFGNPKILYLRSVSSV